VEQLRYLKDRQEELCYIMVVFHEVAYILAARKLKCHQ